MSPTLILAERIAQSLISGALIGCVYGLMCLGLGLIFGVMRVINFAQGELMMLGMFATMVVAQALASVLGAGAAPYPAAIAAMKAVALVGAAIQRYLIGPVSRARTGSRSDNHSAQLILTLGVSLILQSVMLMAVGSDARAVRTPLSTQAWEWALSEDMSLFVNKARVAAAVIAALAAAVTFALLHRLAVGRQLRAAADDPEAAIYSGVSVTRANLIAFTLGTGLTALAGGLLATNYPFNPFVGLDFIIVMYAGVVLGGMGSIAGAFWGGATIGLVQQSAGLVLPTQLENTAVFVVFLLVILLRPQGFFGRSVDRA